MSVTIRVLALPLFSLACACGATASYVATAPAASPHPAESVALMFGAPPSNCNYREVGYVEGESNNATPADALNAMRAQAGSRGADAIVLIDHQDPGGHHGPTGHNFSAVAIAFVGAPCSGTGLLRANAAPVLTLSPPTQLP